jgi:hypothetical protein
LLNLRGKDTTIIPIMQINALKSALRKHFLTLKMERLKIERLPAAIQQEGEPNPI